MHLTIDDDDDDDITSHHYSGANPRMWNAAG